MSYLGQEQPAIPDEMTEEVIRAFGKCRADGLELPNELYNEIRWLAVHGSHVARNMLYLSGFEMYYDGQLFEYQTAKFIKPEKGSVKLQYEEWSDVNES